MQTASSPQLSPWRSGKPEDTIPASSRSTDSQPMLPSSTGTWGWTATSHRAGPPLVVINFIDATGAHPMADTDKFKVEHRSFPDHLYVDVPTVAKQASALVFLVCVFSLIIGY